MIKLTEENITAHADSIDWNYISKEINLSSFSDDFFQKFKNELNWFYITFNKSLTHQFIENNKLMFYGHN